jgi:hypothetical protein
MRRAFIAAALLVAVLALPTGAGAVNSITLRLGDEFAVNKTHLLCAVQISKSLIPGEKLVACFYATAKGPVPKTYTVALAVNGEAALGRIGSNGKLQVVMKRGGSPGPRQGGTERQGALHAVGLGTALLVKGTAIACAVNKQKFGGKAATTVVCFKLNASKKPRPGSYGIGITDGGAFIVRFDAKSKAIPVKIVAHGK